MAANLNSGGDTDSDGFVYEGVKLQTAEDYKQHRKVQAILDAQETFLDRRETAYEYFWEGRIGRDDYLKAVRMAAERYLMLSKQAMRQSEYSQWFWAGEPPTMRGQSPFDASGELDAILDTDMVELPNGKERKAKNLVRQELADNRKTKFRVKKPVLVTEGGEPLFGTERNILGVLPMPEVDKQLSFQGIESFWEADDPIRRQSESVEDHPMRLRQSTREVYEYQIPESISMEVFDQINDFWWISGMSVKLDRGQTIIRDFDMSHHEKYVHTDGSPEV